ncbi:MAG: hypothetical protein HYX69_22055 [Planctomycetia bacterium]|nr:hypothetical protein [Planctomycetia bacterium]
MKRVATASRTFPRPWLPGFFAVVLACSACRAGDVHSLAALVPDDVGLCVEVRNLAGQFDEYQTGELYRRVSQFPALERFLAKNGAKVSKLADEIHRQTGLSTEEILRKLLGKRFLLAFWPDSAAFAKGQPGPAILIFESTDGDLLGRAVERLLDAERAAGWRVVPRQWRHGGATHVIYRIEPGPKDPPVFLATSGAMGIIATDERAIATAIAFHKGARPTRALADLPAYASGVGRLNPDAVLQMFVNPRAWKELLDACAKDGQVPAVQRSLLEAFQKSEYLVASLQLAPKFVLEGFLRTDLVVASPVAGGSLAPREELAERLPAAAIVALAGRIDLASLVGGFFRERAAKAASGANAPIAARDRLDVTALTALTSGRGYDAVAALAERKSTAGPADKTGTAKGAVPLDWAIGVDTSSILAEDRPLVAQGLDPLVRAGLTAAIVAFNRQGHNVRIESSEQQGVPLASVEGVSVAAEPGETAASTSLGPFYWAGSSRDAVRDAARLEASESLASVTHFQAMANPRLRGRTHLAYFQLGTLRELLAAADAPTSQLGAADAPRPTAGRDNDLVEILKLADRLLFEARVDHEGIAVSTTLAAEPRR